MRAFRVSVEFVRNALGGLESIVIRDNGIGISKARAEHDFASLGESWIAGRSPNNESLNFVRERFPARAVRNRPSSIPCTALWEIRLINATKPHRAQGLDHMPHQPMKRTRRIVQLLWRHLDMRGVVGVLVGQIKSNERYFSNT